jgi:hypothetical protein
MTRQTLHSLWLAAAALMTSLAGGMAAAHAEAGVVNYSCRSAEVEREIGAFAQSGSATLFTHRLKAALETGECRLVLTRLGPQSREIQPIEATSKYAEPMKVAEAPGTAAPQPAASAPSVSPAMAGYGVSGAVVQSQATLPKPAPKPVVSSKPSSEGGYRSEAKWQEVSKTWPPGWLFKPLR